jgi:thioredoxin-dependent peroxiredoxin
MRGRGVKAIDFHPGLHDRAGLRGAAQAGVRPRGCENSLSIDPVDAHAKWSQDIERTQGHAPNFPIVADPDRKVANLYGMMHPAHDEVYTVRTVFVIDPTKKIRLMITYPQTTGRNDDVIIAPP